jgi:hypothetical protein
LKRHLAQFFEYSKHSKINKNLQELSFNIRLKDSPFFLDSSSLAYDIDLYSWSNPPKFYLSEKEYFYSTTRKRLYSEIIPVSFIPINFQCEYFTFPYTDGDEELYARNLKIIERE